MIKILFIDSDHERLDQMIEAFKGFSDAEILKYSKNNVFKRNYEFNEWEKIQDLEEIEPDVIFRHGRDFFPDEGIKSKAKLKICYGGYEGVDPDSSDDEENIYRSI
ncbi:MAG: hypothetical protein IH594_10785, partial [Bacteroidales bacterium]|nr:hypothetical protein [Bacteroidales bacterium]